jgi:5-(carboxyamino)imidazole ribonucleotide mutase
VNQPLPLVGVIMGSRSDWRNHLDKLAVSHEVRVVSAHRTAHHLLDQAEQADCISPDPCVATSGKPR